MDADMGDRVAHGVPVPDKVRVLLSALLVLMVTCEDRSPVEAGLN
jgi:hypothetical protein